MSLDRCLARKRLREWLNIIRSLVMKSITSENSQISEADATMGEIESMIERLKQHGSYNPNRGVTGIAVFLKEKGES